MGELKDLLLSLNANSASRTIHQIRVLSRRQRALCRLLSALGAPKGVGRLEKRLRRLTQKLSVVRSWDVSLGQMKDLEKEWKRREDRGLGFLREICRVRRNKIRARVLAGLSSKKILKSLKWDEAWLAGEWFSESVLEDQLIKEVGQASKTVLKKWKRFQAGGTLRDLHEMRICWKKLRYTLEIQFHCFEVPEEETLGEFKFIQDQLGQIQDLQSLKSHLKENAVRKKVPSGRRSRFRRFKAFLNRSIEQAVEGFCRGHAGRLEALIGGVRP